MGSKVAMSWTSSSDLEAKIKGGIDDSVRRYVTGVFEYSKLEAIEYMKENAPWTDRTGNARSGLFAITNYGDDYWELVLAHSVFYGIYLETRFSGKYAIIAPTVLEMGNRILNRLDSLFDKVNLGGQSE